jgi:hypothetical protein
VEQEVGDYVLRRLPEHWVRGQRWTEAEALLCDGRMTKIFENRKKGFFL